MMKTIVMLLLVFSSFLTFGQIEIEVSADQDTVYAGADLKLTYRIVNPNNVEINSLDFSPLRKSYNWLNTFMPDQVDSFLVVNIVDGGAYKISNENLTVSKRNFNGKIPLQGTITVNVGRMGLISLPVPNINNQKNRPDYSVENLQQSKTVFVDIPQGQTGLNPDWGIIEEPTTWLDYLNPRYIYVYLIFAAFALTLFFVITYLRKGKKGFNVQRIEIIRPADEVAFEDLDLLKEKQLWQNGDTKGYHTELTRIMRQYIENRYNVQALEMTSSQLKRELNQKEIDSGIVGRFDDILQIADKIKFAKGDAGPEINEKFMQEAYSIVKETKEVIKENVEEK